MVDTLTRVYALLVCFVCMVCITITTGMGIYEIVKVTNPLITLSGYRYENLSSSESFRHMVYPAVPVHPGGLTRFNATVESLRPDMTDEEVEALRQGELAKLVRSERRSAISSLIRIAIVLLVASPVFYIHWRISQRSKPAPA